MKLPSRGWGPWKQEFYSIHSNPTLIEQDVNHEDGFWHNVWIQKFSSFVYDRWPNFWKWYVNLPPFYHRRIKRYQKFFPNLK